MFNFSSHEINAKFNFFVCLPLEVANNSEANNAEAVKPPVPSFCWWHISGGHFKLIGIHDAFFHSLYSYHCIYLLSIGPPHLPLSDQ